MACHGRRPRMRGISAWPAKSRHLTALPSLACVKVRQGVIVHPPEMWPGKHQARRASNIRGMGRGIPVTMEVPNNEMLATCRNILGFVVALAREVLKQCG